MKKQTELKIKSMELKKSTVAHLDSSQLSHIYGGSDEPTTVNSWTAVDGKTKGCN